MSDVVLFESRQLRSESLGLKINNNISIPWVRVLMRNKFSSGICSFKLVVVFAKGRAEIDSAKTSDFFDLAAVNSK